MHDQPSELPLFPLKSVLFPGARLLLKVFEPRYMDMITRCLRDGSHFGVCLIAEGQEVGAPALPHPVGTSAAIQHCDMEQAGLLKLVVAGERRFRVVHQQTQPDGLLRAVVEWLPQAAPQPVPEAMADLLPLLHAVVADAGPTVMPEPHHFDAAEWVGFRYAEILPIPVKAKQKLLELDDAEMRLTIIREFLFQRNLLQRPA